MSGVFQRRWPCLGATTGVLVAIPSGLETSATMSGLYLTRDLLFSSKVTAIAQQLGFSLETVDSSARLIERVVQFDGSLVLLDLTFPNLDVTECVTQLRSATSSALTIVAFGPHVHHGKLDAAVSAGCDEILSRGQLHRDCRSLLARYMAN